MPGDDVRISISGREAKLILEYGYPFPEQAELLKPLSDQKGMEEVSIGRYWLELIIGDLCRSIKETEDYHLQEELDSLCDSLENTIQQGSNRYVV
jgi:hypothetical protein